MFPDKNIQPLKFLPVETSSVVGILVLTTDEYLQPEIELALHEYQHIVFTGDTDEAFKLLSDGQIGIVIIDANILETDDNDLIAEMLSSFSKLVLVSLIETGNTQGLATLSEKYDIYRYLKVPCTHKQIVNCVKSALKKHLKKYGNKNTESNGYRSLPFLLYNKHIVAIVIAVTTIVLVILLTIFNPDTESNQQNVLVQNQEQTVEQTGNSALSKSTPTIPSKAISAIDQFLLDADAAYKIENYYVPEQNNALFFYIQTLHLEPKNQKALTGLNKVLNVMVDNIDTSLKQKKYHHAVKLGHLLAKKLPDGSLTKQLLKPLSDQGLALANQAKRLADDGELDLAKLMLIDATTLLGQDHVEINIAQAYISAPVEPNNQFHKFLEKAQLRLNSENLSKPINDSAKFYLLSLDEIAPKNDKVTSLLNQLADKLLKHADTAINKDNIPKAKYFIQEAKTLGILAKTSAISTLEKKIITKNNIQQNIAPVTLSISTKKLTNPQATSIQERIKKQEKINALLASARKASIAKKYFSPKNNNASHFLLLAKKINNQNEDVIYNLNELADKILSIIKIKLADKKMTEANTLINHAKQLGVRVDAIRKLEQEAYEGDTEQRKFLTGKS